MACAQCRWIPSMCVPVRDVNRCKWHGDTVRACPTCFPVYLTNEPAPAPAPAEPARSFADVALQQPSGGGGAPASRPTPLSLSNTTPVRGPEEAGTILAQASAEGERLLPPPSIDFDLWRACAVRGESTVADAIAAARARGFAAGLEAAAKAARGVSSTSETHTKRARAFDAAYNLAAAHVVERIAALASAPASGKGEG